jgi:hypothetical protein
MSIQPNFATCSMVFKLVWGHVLSCSRRHLVFTGLTLAWRCNGQSWWVFRVAGNAGQFTSVQGIPESALSSHITVATAETHYPPHCVHIHCLASVNVNGCNFSRVEEFNDTFLLRTHFYVRRHFVRLLLDCCLLHGNKTYKLLVGRFNLYCYTTSIRL